MGIDSKGDGELKDSSSDGTDPELTRWVFDDGRLSEYFLLYAKSDMQQHLKFLTTAYGPPATHGFRDFQNQFGASWKRLQVTWNTTDGGLITLSELTAFDHAGEFCAFR